MKILRMSLITVAVVVPILFIEVAIIYYALKYAYYCECRKQSDSKEDSKYASAVPDLDMADALKE